MRRFVVFLAAVLTSAVVFSGGPLVQGQASSQDETTTRVYPYYTVHTIMQKGTAIDEVIINGPPEPPPGTFRSFVAELPQPDQAQGINSLSNVPAFTWSFGCSATSAAMIAGYYDRTTYPNMYTGPTNGGVMPMDNSSWPDWYDGSAWRNQCPLSATHKGLDGRATRGHVDDYWIAYGRTDPDPFIGHWAQHAYGDCTADYMKTNQSSYGNSDGATTFWNYSSGSPLSWSDLESSGHQTNDGGYGLKLFYESRGYTVADMYNQYIKGRGTNPALGFTYAQYKAEIDAGRPVMIQLAGHTVVGVGYDDSANRLYIHDTWDYSTHTMTWGGTYAGMQQYGVTIVCLASGAGDVYAFGCQSEGRLGLGDTPDCPTPTKIATLPGPAKAVAAGYGHSLAVLQNGDVYAFGHNSRGQLGLGDKNVDRWTPAEITTLPGPATAVAAGEGGLLGDHSLALLENGDVYAFGDNGYGELGLGNKIDRWTPTKITTLPGPARAFAAGGAFSLILLQNGDVYAFGRNDHGELGLGDKIDRWTPTKITTLPGPARAVAVGGTFSLVLLQNGDVYAFGGNWDYQLGLGDTTDRPIPTKITTLPGPATAIAAGGVHSLILLLNGDVYAFGFNNHGELGLGDTAHRETPTKIAALPGPARAVAAGGAFSLVLLQDGDVYAFGGNSDGELGLGDTIERDTPTKIATLSGTVVAVAAGSAHSLVVLQASPSPPHAPFLTWTGEPGFTADGVDPDSGTSATTFAYHVMYTSADNKAPKADYPKVHILKGGSEIGTFTMTAVDTAPFTTGRRYSFGKSGLAAGTDYTYWVEAQDNLGNSATGAPTSPTGGPSVAVSGWFDDVESGPNGWVGTGTGSVSWHITQLKANSPTHSWWFGNEAAGNYRSGSARVSGTLTSSSIPVIAGAAMRISFQSWRQVESYKTSPRDKTWVDAKLGSGTWQTKWSRDSKTASTSAWEPASFDLAVPAGVTTLQIRFQFDSVNGTSNTYAGWFIDDIRVEVAPPLFIVTPTTGIVPDGGTKDLGVRLSGPPTGTVQASVSWLSGDSGVSVKSGGTLTFDSTNWSTDHVVTLLAIQETQGDKPATFRIHGTSGPAVPDKDVTVTGRHPWLDTVEAGLNGWAPAGGTGTVTWHITQLKANSPTHSWWFGNDTAGTYASGTSQVKGTLTSPSIPVPSGTKVTVSFLQWRQVEYYRTSARDKTWVDAKVGTASWQTKWSRDSKTASTSTWELISFDLAVPAGTTTLQLRFQFDSVNGTNNTYSGWFIDDIRVAVRETGAATLSEAETAGVVEVVPVPNPFADETRFTVRGAEAEAVRVQVFDLSGAVVWEGEASGNELVWSGETTDGQPLANGVYLYLATALIDGEWITTPVGKVVILR